MFLSAYYVGNGNSLYVNVRDPVSPVLVRQGLLQERSSGHLYLRSPVEEEIASPQPLRSRSEGYDVTFP